MDGPGGGEGGAARVRGESITGVVVVVVVVVASVAMVAVVVLLLSVSLRRPFCS